MIWRCECGGTIRKAMIKEFDFTPLAGISSTLRNVKGLTCDRCHLSTIEGTIINSTLCLMEIEVAKQPDRLTAEHAAFLRQRMHLTQQALAGLMGVARETVADWERGRDPISAQHDLVLRAIVITHLMEIGALPKQERVMEAIRSVRILPPHKASTPLVISKVA